MPGREHRKGLVLSGWCHLYIMSIEAAELTLVPSLTRRAGYQAEGPGNGTAGLPGLSSPWAAGVPGWSHPLDTGHTVH